jgi:hypothetical protein
LEGLGTGRVVDLLQDAADSSQFGEFLRQGCGKVWIGNEQLFIGDSLATRSSVGNVEDDIANPIGSHSRSLLAR